jgi:hypothetical protein
MKIEIIFRPVTHNPMEIQMGQAIWFTPINGIDGISSTANFEGFKPLSSISSAYDWDGAIVQEASKKSNLKNEIAIVKQVKPTLFLVPKTKGNSNTEFLIKDLALAINEMKIKNLHFTHYGFIQKKFPKNEFQTIVQFLHKPLFDISLEKIIIDIDSRNYSEIK